MALNIELKNPGAFPNIQLASAASGRTCTLETTEPADTSSINAASIASLSLAATDAPDTTEIETASTVSGYLSASDTPDTAEITAEAQTAIIVNATDSADTAEITSASDISASLETTEALDRANIKITDTEEKPERKGHAPFDWDLFSKRLKGNIKPRKIKITASENADSCNIDGYVNYPMLNIKSIMSERGDGIVILSRLDNDSAVKIKDSKDRTIIDEDLFRAQVKKMNADYEANEMIIFALAS